MQNAETVLGVLRERGRRGLPCDELYRQLFNPSLYLMAYGNIYSNQGAMTPGVTGETADGMSLDTIERIIDAMRHERYRFSPVRRIYFPKPNGKLRPLGLPTWSDKLVGEVVRLLLEAYYEPTFSDHSHGFRPGRGCHTALRKVAETWTGTTWFIEGDISDCFGSFDHEVMLAMLAEKIHDNRFLRLLHTMLQAGYLQDWEYHATFSGAPQGGVASPVLSNIYLHRLDTFVETVLIPRYTQGRHRASNFEYKRIASAVERARKRGDRAQVRALRTRLRELPSQDPQDPNYRRLRYARYADDHLLGFVGPKAEAEQIKQHLTQFLRDDLKLELSPEKTLITHARTGAARFLGYEVTVQHGNRKLTRGRRAVNGVVRLRVPTAVIKAKCALYCQRGKPATRTPLVNRGAFDIVATYGAQYRGLVQYYLLAGDVYRLNRLHGVMRTSMLKTLACKYDSTTRKIAAKIKTKIETPHGLRTCHQIVIERTGRKPLVARFGGIPLKRQPKAVITDRIPERVNYPRKELPQRLLRGICELCEQHGNVAVHQVRKLADLDQPGPTQPAWAKLMAKRRRKTLIVCQPCHHAIHAQPATASPTA